jgi:hypothetical protein
MMVNVDSGHLLEVLGFAGARISVIDLIIEII